MDGWMDWLRGRLFSFPEDPVNRKPPSVRAAAGQVRAAAGQPTPAARVHLEALFKNVEIGCSEHPQDGWIQLSALKGCRSPWPGVAGLYKEKRELRTGGSFQPFLGGSEHRCFPSSHCEAGAWAE